MNINDMEKQLKTVNPELELYRYDYINGEISNMVIRLPSENNIGLIQKLLRFGWKTEKKEILGINNETGIKGWEISRIGRKYLRMSGDINCFFDFVETEGNRNNDVD